MTIKIGNTIGEYLKDLEVTVDQLADTWRPDDPQYRADVYRQTMMNLSYAYFAYFHADAEHPDWAPLWNPVYTVQPNPDDIYLYAPIRGDLTYRVSGTRGTCALLTFNTQKGWVGLIDELAQISHARDFDDRSLAVGPNGEIEVILSAERPAGYTGNWAQIAPEADTVVVRYRSVDWVNERDPQLTIECLDPVPLKRRLSQEEILERIVGMAKLPARYNKAFLPMQNDVKAEVGLNAFVHRKYPTGGLSKQIYWPAVFDLDDGEALILETDMPKVRHYWNIQLNDPLFNAVEYVYRLSSLNAATAQDQFRRQAAGGDRPGGSRRPQLARSRGLQARDHLRALVRLRHQSDADHQARCAGRVACAPAGRHAHSDADRTRRAAAGACAGGPAPSPLVSAIFS